MVAGLMIQLLLPRALGSPARFGMWTLVLGWVSSINNVVVTGTIQGVSHFAAAGPAAAEAAKAAALRMQIFVGGAAALLFFLLSPVIAAFEHDGDLPLPLRLSALIVLCYSFYAIFVGAANGAREFHKQAGLDITFSTLRCGLVVGAAYVFHSAVASVLGFVGAAVVIAGVSVLVVGWPRPAAGAPELPVQALLKFIGWLLVYLLALNQLMFLDGFWLKRLCAEAYAGVVDGKQQADALVGIYGAAQTVARLPYQLILAGAFVIFPLMSRAAVERDAELVRSYIVATLRYSLVAVGAVVIGLGVRPQATMRLLYPAEYAVGAPALQVLLFAYVVFSLFAIVGTILNGVGRLRATAALGVLTFVLTTATTYASIRLGLLSGEQPLRPAAQGLLLGLSAGLLLTLGYLWWAFRVTFAARSVVRVGLAALLSLALSQRWPAVGTPGLWGSKVGTLLCAVLAAVVYLVALLLTRELVPSEVLQLRRARARVPGDGEGAGGGA